MIVINKSTLFTIGKTIGQRLPESGGIIGSQKSVICEFYFDSDGVSTDLFYQPSSNVEWVIRKWNSQGIVFEGFIHSHRSYFAPTLADIKYSLAVLQWYEAEFQTSKNAILVPIVQTIHSSNEFHLFGFSTDKAQKISKHEICEV